VDPSDKKGEEGLTNFEEGLSMIAEEEYEAAAAYLARAVHYSPQNALYHAYLGMAMSRADDKYRHKAEGELQTATKLDPKNPKIRMMLVDFLIDLKMAKRAEGELKRFLELVPNNKEAMAALAKLQ
ncbi:MAG: tetratricopeptide repeat protein, partial [Pyrinomonadaceae bacterium]